MGGWIDGLIDKQIDDGMNFLHIFTLGFIFLLVLLCIIVFFVHTHFRSWL